VIPANQNRRGILAGITDPGYNSARAGAAM